MNTDKFIMLVARAQSESELWMNMTSTSADITWRLASWLALPRPCPFWFTCKS